MIYKGYIQYNDYEIITFKIMIYKRYIQHNNFYI